MPAKSTLQRLIEEYSEELKVQSHSWMGRECLAVTGSFGELLATVAYMVDDDTREEIADALATTCFDAKGKFNIFFWPRIAFYQEPTQCIDPKCPDAATMPYHDHP